MDWSKLDAPLAAAVSEEDDGNEAFRVFVTALRPPTAAERRTVSSLTQAASDGTTYTAALSSDEVAQLSEEHWVESLHLSQILRPLQGA